MIYFTSDLHFNHDKAFVYKPRGFNSIEEMNETLIKNWNETVKTDDIVYVLGDFFLGSDLDFVTKTLYTLNGTINLIIGNHDTNAKLNIYRNSQNINSILFADKIKYEDRQFYLSHYPTLTADLQSNPDKAVFNLFGHTHSNKKFFEDRPYMYNVAVDAHNNKPVSLQQIYSDILQEIEKCTSYLT